MLREHPVTGVGAGAYEIAYPRYQSWTSDLTIDHAHNDYVELLAETGAIGGLLAVAVISILLHRGYGIVRRLKGANILDSLSMLTRLEAVELWMRFGALVACCGLLVHSFTDFNLHIPANAAFAALAAGLAVEKKPEPK